MPAPPLPLLAHGAAMLSLHALVSTASGCVWLASTACLRPALLGVMRDSSLEMGERRRGCCSPKADCCGCGCCCR